MDSGNLDSFDRTTAVLVVSYPGFPGVHFDWNYYVDFHLPLVHKLLDPLGLRNVHIDRPLDGEPIALAHLEFDDLATLERALAAAKPPLDADVPNFYSGAPDGELYTRMPGEARARKVT